MKAIAAAETSKKNGRRTFSFVAWRRPQAPPRFLREDERDGGLSRRRSTPGYPSSFFSAQSFVRCRSQARRSRRAARKKNEGARPGIDVRWPRRAASETRCAFGQYETGRGRRSLAQGLCFATRAAGLRRVGGGLGLQNEAVRSSTLRIAGETGTSARLLARERCCSSDCSTSVQRSRNVGRPIDAAVDAAPEWRMPKGVDAGARALAREQRREAVPDGRRAPTTRSRASTRPFPRRFHRASLRALQARGIEQLYTHQARAVETRAREGARALVVATPTASGKSLCFHLPVLEALAKNPDARAIYLFPTKALARDQEASLAK